MFYGLTQKEDTYFADKVAKAIFLAPCIYSGTGFMDLETYLEVYPVFRDKGVNVIQDSNWESSLKEICSGDTPEVCDYAGEF